MLLGTQLAVLMDRAQSYLTVKSFFSLFRIIHHGESQELNVLLSCPLLKIILSIYYVLFALWEIGH